MANPNPKTSQIEKYKWKKGIAPNPKGRPPIGLTITEWENALGGSDLTTKQLIRIDRDEKQPHLKRVAAQRILRARDSGDLADFGAVLDGTSNLDRMRRAGKDTTVVKKCKSRPVVAGMDSDGNPIMGVEREIELHDRALEEFKTLVDYTWKKPSQQVELTTRNENYEGPDPKALADPEVEALALRLAHRMQDIAATLPAPGDAGAAQIGPALGSNGQANLPHQTRNGSAPHPPSIGEARQELPNEPGNTDVVPQQQP